KSSTIFSSLLFKPVTEVALTKTKSEILTKSFIKIKNSNGPRILAWGTPRFIFLTLILYLLKHIASCFLCSFLRYLKKHFLYRSLSIFDKVLNKVDSTVAF